MALTEAKARANKKYLQTQEDIRIRVPNGEKEIIQAHATEMGESTNAFIRRAIAETMERDKSKNQK